MTRGGTPRELYVLRPDRMKVVPGPRGWPIGYDYTVDGRTTRIGPRRRPASCRCCTPRLFHPLDDHYGLSPIEAAARAVDIHNAGGGWTKSLLDNAARPSGALIYKGPDGAPGLSDDQFPRLKRELEDAYQGATNAGRPMVLEGGLDWRAMSYTPADMDFAGPRNAAAREIALAFGVPPMLLGIPGRQHLFELPRGQSGVVAPDDAAAGRAHRRNPDPLAGARASARPCASATTPTPPRPWRWNAKASGTG